MFLADDVCLCHCIEECVIRATDATVYEDILRYKTTQEYPADATMAVKRRLREKSESFTVQESTLYHKGHKGKQAENNSA